MLVVLFALPIAYLANKVQSQSKLDRQNPSTTSVIVVKGTKLKAFIVAYEDFMQIKSLGKNKKKIENYNIGFNEDKESYYIFFRPKESAKGKSGKVRVIGGQNEFGKHMRYTILKSNFAIKQRANYR